MGDTRRGKRIFALAFFSSGVVAWGCGCLTGCLASRARRNYDMVVVDKKSDRQVVVEFDGQCAMGVAEGHFNVPGDRKYVLHHGGKTYYFANQASKDRFERDVEANVRRAREQWAQAHAGV